MDTHASEHLYIHVPFCDGKCLYCAFYSEPYAPDRADAYLKALATEFDLYLASHSRPAPRTIYCGGGTASILSTEQIKQLCQLLCDRMESTQLVEWTMEGNPGTFSSAMLNVLRQYGVNRISLGAQSFDDHVLEQIGRRHNAADIERTVHAARSAGFSNISMDLMACLPGVWEDGWMTTLQNAMALNPTHISVYALTVEKGTPLGRLVRTGDVIIPDDDEQVRTLQLAETLLGEAGFVRYEISNYARPGFECVHNVACWRGEDYLGLGPGAASRSGRRRWTNKPSLKDYVDALRLGEEPPREEDVLSEDTDITERLIFGFRLTQGVDLRRFSGASPRLRQHWNATLQNLRKTGLVERSDGAWRLTREGRNFADFVAYELLNP